MKSHFLLAVALVFSVSCAKNSMSDRDAKREQLRSAGETKRKELQEVAGEYRGLLVQNDHEQSAMLVLEIKDISTPIEGEVDPVLVPTLKGYLKLIVGGATEFESFAIEKADFDSKTKKLDIVATHVNFKEIIATAVLNETKLSGTWTSPSNAASGNLILDRSQTSSEFETLKGSYQGKLTNTNPQANLPERLMMSIVTAQDPSNPNALKLSGSVRLYVGPFGSTEYNEDAFSDVQYNGFKGLLLGKTTGSNGNPKLTFVGKLKGKILAGTVSADALGEIGTFEVVKQ